VNPNNPNAEPDTKEAQRAAHALGRQLQVLTARTEHEIDIAFASIAQTGALFVNIDSFFGSRRNQIVALAARHVVPAIYPFREHVDGNVAIDPKPVIRLSHQRMSGCKILPLLPDSPWPILYPALWP
jgi:hypothetical protein